MDKNQELDELFQTLSQIYLKNLSFFSKSNPQLHTKILSFEKLNIENYFLEFIDNHFELVDNQNNHIYKCDPFFDAQARSKDIENKPIFNLIRQKEFEEPVVYEQEINAKEFINEYFKEEQCITLNKFVFLGTLLGVHINDLHKVLNSNTYLIIEDCLEIFRLSLFLTDYEQISKDSTVIFCIEESNESKKEIIKKFLNLNNQYNNKIGFELANQFSIDNIEILTKNFIDNDPLNYPFSEYLISFKRAIYNFNTYKKTFLKLANNYEIINKPVLYLGAGPSLSEAIEWIYMNQDYFYIVCAAATLKRLELLDIVPDMILSVDGQKELILKQFKVDEKYHKNSIIISSSKTHKEVIEKSYNKNLFFMPDNLGLFSKCGIFTGLTVGDIGLQLILKLGAKEIYTLGFDAAVSKSGKTHDGIHYTSKVKNEKANILNNSGFNTKKDLIEVKGNFRQKVLTFLLYTQMIDSINLVTANLPKDIKLYNLSDGAYFENIKPLKKEDIIFENLEFLDKSNLQENTSKQLKDIVLLNLEQKDIAYFKTEKKVLKKLNTINEKNYKIIFEKIKKQHTNSLIIQIIDRFFKLTNPYAQQTKNTGSKIQFNQFHTILETLKNTIKLI